MAIQESLAVFEGEVRWRVSFFRIRVLRCVAHATPCRLMAIGCSHQTAENVICQVGRLASQHHGGVVIVYRLKQAAQAEDSYERKDSVMVLQHSRLILLSDMRPPMAFTVDVGQTCHHMRCMGLCLTESSVAT